MDPLAVLSGIGLVGAYWCTSELVMRDRTAVKIDEVSGSDNTTAVYGFKLPIRSSYLVQLQIALFQVNKAAHTPMYSSFLFSFLGG